MTERPTSPRATTEHPCVLLVDSDADVTDVVVAILTDEGYQVTTLDTTDHEALASAVNQFEPDCVLLDSASRPAFAHSWTEAAYLASRSRVVPTIMFTAHTQDVREARENASGRARAAGFAAIVPKPFDLDELLIAVSTACDRSEPFNRSADGERARTLALARRLRDSGATDVRTSNRREWATFVSPHDARIYQLYWWQKLGRYILGRYDEDARLRTVGQYHELEAAIGAASDQDRDLNGEPAASSAV